MTLSEEAGRDVLLSFIVPVYNGETTIRRCLDSIIDQMHDDYEIICIDDGSTDASPEILDEYAARHQSVTVLHSSNEGPSAARTRGVQVAVGTYLTFVDSDDHYRDGALSKIIAAVKKHPSLPVYVFGYLERTVQNGDLIDHSPSVAEGVCSMHNFLDNYAQPEWIALLNFLFNKVYRSDIAKKNSFDRSITLGEDALYNYDCYARCSQVYVSGWAGYIYENHSAESLSRGRDLDEVWNAYRTIVCAIMPLLKQYGLEDHASRLYTTYVISMAHEYLRKPKMEVHPQERQAVVDALNDELTRKFMPVSMRGIGKFDSLLLHCAKRRWGRLGLILCEIKRR